MKSSTRDKTEGALHQAKDKAKEMAGELTNNPIVSYSSKINIKL